MSINIFSKAYWDGTPPIEAAPAPKQEDYSNSPFNMDYPQQGGTVGRVWAVYDGETNQGEFGPPKEYMKDWYTLRVRSKQLFTESLVARGIVLKFLSWVIGKGLVFKAEPKKDVLKRDGITLDTEAFNTMFEERWDVYANSKLPDYTGKNNLYFLMQQGYLEGKLGGDVLVVLRVVNGIVKVQHIDGSHVGNPPNCIVKFNDKNLAGTIGYAGYDYIYQPTGNRIRYGVEMDNSGRYVAYHVRVGALLEFKRIPARDSKGFIRAYMYYGKRLDLDATRGSCLLETALENCKKLDRYIGAVVNGAEQRAKFAVFFEHGTDSLEDDPMAGTRAKTYTGMRTPDGNGAATDVAIDAAATKIASDVSVTMNGTFMNLPKGVSANSLESKQELYVGEFEDTIVGIICMGLEIPPSVAKGEYTDSFSASRMAGMDWQHTFLTDREDFAQQYLNPIKQLQMYIWVLEMKIQAPGYLQKMADGNEMAIAAYNHCRWVGNMFPDVDPLKTANYFRIMMGAGFEHMPLMTPEAAAELGGQGEYEAILRQSAKSKDLAEQLGIEDVLTRGETIADDAPAAKTTPKTANVKNKRRAP